MSANHTPGPWEFIDATTSARFKFAPVCIIRAGEKQIGSFSWNDNSPWFPTQEQSQANARLMAAAPDLLEAALAQEELTSLRMPGDPAENILKVRAMRRAAIAKALPPNVGAVRLSETEVAA